MNAKLFETTNMKKHALLLGGLMAVAATATARDVVDLSKIDVSKLPPASTKTGLTYSKDIQPLLAASCTRCHGQDRPKAGLQLTSLEAILKGTKEGKVVVPGDSKKSLLVIAAAQIDDETAMPPKRGPGHGGPGGPGGNRPPGGPQGGGPNGPGGFGPPPKPLTAEQVGLLRAWVDQGSK
jgi:hypothetical protein